MKSWLRQHYSALLWALQRLLDAPVNTLLSLLAIGTALALPASGQMLLNNVLHGLPQASSEDSGSGLRLASPQLSLFLNTDADRKTVDAVAGKLRKHEGIASQRFISRADTLKRMQADPGMRDLLAALPENPYPDTFILTPKSDAPAALDRLRDELKSWPGVEHVQLDSAWVRRLDALLRLGRSGLLVLATLLGVGLIAITFTTLRLQILVQRNEIEISRLLGATHAYIRRPFLYLGALQGLAGGMTAWLIVLAITLTLRGPTLQLTSLYGNRLILQSLPLTDTLLLLTLATALGTLGAALSLVRHLHETAPEIQETASS